MIRTETRPTAATITRTIRLGTFLGAAIAMSGVASAQDACPVDGAGAPGALHEEWIMVGWEKNEGDPPFDFDAKLGKFYAQEGEDVRLYDNFDTEHRVATSAEAYSDIWTEPFTSMISVNHQVLDGPDVVMGESELAASTLEFAGLLRTGDDQVVPIRTRSSLVWRCEAGAWQIVREHNSSRIVEEAELAPFFD